MDTQQALLRAILLNPADDVARLVYADWLEEYGNDAARAECIRWHVGCAVPFWFDPKRDLWRNKAKQGVEMPPDYFFAYISEFLGDPAEPRDVTVNRGFVSEAHLPLAAFMEHAKALFSAHPIESVTLTDRIMQIADGPNGAVGWFDCRYDTVGQCAASHKRLPRVLLRDQRDQDEEFGSEEEGAAWLSAQCVDYGRSLAGLPPLPA